MNYIDNVEEEIANSAAYGGIHILDIYTSTGGIHILDIHMNRRVLEATIS